MDQDLTVLLSVIMPVYNAEAYLHQSIKSILDQTFVDFEFIIIDDGSTDHSLDIIQFNAQEDPRIKVVSRENRGLVATLNEGVQLSRGKYIARMDADDISRSDRFSAQLLELERGDCDLVGSYIQMMGGPHNEKHIRYPIKDQDIKFRMLFGSGFAHPAVMIKTNILKMHPYVRPEGKDFTGHSEDYDLWSRLAIQGFMMANIPVALLQYRINDQQYTRKYVEKQQLSTRLIASNYAFQKYGLSKNDILYYLYGQRHLRVERKLNEFVFELITLAVSENVSSEWIVESVNEIAIRMPESFSNSLSLLKVLYLKKREFLNRRLIFSLLFKTLPRIKNDKIRHRLAQVARKIGFRI